MNHDLFRNHDETGQDEQTCSNEITLDSRGQGRIKSARTNTVKYNSNSVGDYQDFEQHGSKLKEREIRRKME